MVVNFRKPRILLIGGAGYIGSYIYPRLVQDGHEIRVCDIGLRGYPHGPVDHPVPYVELDRATLSEYSHVLWFGGHSNVRTSIDDPQGALLNNCINLVHLFHNLGSGTRVIYASTASLYSQPYSSEPHEVPWSSESDKLFVNVNSYDNSKFVFDSIAANFLNNFIGLRLGTVCGWSPNLRSELIFNAMNLSAANEGMIRVANPHAHRTILFLDDLYTAVHSCIVRREIPDGFFNLGTCSTTIGELAKGIGSYYGAEIVSMPDTPTYSFRIDTSKAAHEFGITGTTDIAARCEQFRNDLISAPFSTISR